MVINRLKISDGNVASDGGGITNEGDSLTLINSTVSGNNASIDGGGIFSDDASSRMTLTNSTVSDNTAGDGGAATLHNTIVAGSFADSSPDASGTYLSQGNNLIRNTSGAFGFGGPDVLDKNPLLGPLQDNG